MHDLECATYDARSTRGEAANDGLVDSVDGDGRLEVGGLDARTRG